ncbi:MAG: Cell division inhibitor [uncultured Rubrobacteraceae bacterium]|uniref:Cell division inhibitor n=1 Tax=uncultured Rubrobacteraceae bacterium TaxID=349277 RepID=A0A6J4TV32_9ACTN|nr:MAG: Cell division inhibitor [uncultured Rubrobacteraceae bacterium]
MNVLISGATGLIGSALVPELEANGHTVTRLSRSRSGANTVRWDPSAGTIEGDLEGTEAVVHLAGESIAQGRWSPDKKRRILDSRVEGTRLLAERIAALSTPPKVMVSTSAVGFYGDRGDEVLTEESGPGEDFLAGVCREWEAAAEPARRAGIRVVHPRLGIVLSPQGGALGTTLPIFKLGGGGKIGSGRQWWSWVALDDVVGSIVHALTDETIEGPVNVGSPNPMTNAEYTKVLGKVLGRPTVLPLPAPAARIMLGEVADALLLASQRMEPAKLKATGYGFRHPQLEGALRHLLGR